MSWFRRKKTTTEETMQLSCSAGHRVQISRGDFLACTYMPIDQRLSEQEWRDRCTRLGAAINDAISRAYEAGRASGQETSNGK